MFFKLKCQANVTNVTESTKNSHYAFERFSISLIHLEEGFFYEIPLPRDNIDISWKDYRRISMVPFVRR